MHDRAAEPIDSREQSAGAPFTNTIADQLGLIAAASRLGVQAQRLRTAGILREAGAMERATWQIGALLAEATLLNDRINRILAKHRNG
jgi:hypothetical protein